MTTTTRTAKPRPTTKRKAPGKTAPTSKTKPAAKHPTATTTKPTRPAPAPTAQPTAGRFGNRPGTIRAAINAALSKRPQTMKELMAAVGSTKTHYNHVNRLVAAGHVVKDDDGKYRLK